MMKKTLVAVAALAATASFAQVTIFGLLDFAASNSSGTNTAVTNGSTIATSTGTSSTSAIKIQAVENLGGGLTATAFYELDPRSLSNDGLGTTNNTATAGSVTAGSTLGATATGLNRGEAFIALSGNMGKIALGAPNAVAFGTVADSSALGTGIGSGYTSNNGKSATMMNAIVQTRYSRSARYDSPAVGGFTVSALIAPGGDETAITVASTTVSGGHTALTIPNARKGSEFGLAYAAGPLKVNFSQINQGAQTNLTGWYAAAASTTNTSKTSTNLLGANYKLGATTVYGLWAKGDQLAATGATAPTEAKANRFAIKHSMGAMDLMAQHTTYSTSTAGTAAYVKQTVAGVRADYNLSKTAAAYIGYEEHDSGASSANTHKIASIGLRKSF